MSSVSLNNQMCFLDIPQNMRVLHLARACVVQSNPLFRRQISCGTWILESERNRERRCVLEQPFFTVIDVFKIKRPISERAPLTLFLLWCPVVAKQVCRNENIHIMMKVPLILAISFSPPPDIKSLF